MSTLPEHALDLRHFESKFSHICKSP